MLRCVAYVPLLYFMSLCIHALPVLSLSRPAISSSVTAVQTPTRKAVYFTDGEQHKQMGKVWTLELEPPKT